MKKITTLLLAILMVLPAMAATFKSGDVIYLNANIWNQGGAKFSAAFDDSDFANEFGEKTSEGYYKFTVPGSAKTYSKVRFVRNTNAATQAGWDPKWNETAQYAAVDGKNLFTVTGWTDGADGKSSGSWSVYEVLTTETLTYNVTVPVGTPACYIAGDMNEWQFTPMTKVDDTHYTITYKDVMKTDQYKYTCDTSWDYAEIGSNRTWSENDKVLAWSKMPAIDDITFGVYCLDISESQWADANAWFSAYFYNNTSNIWVRGVVKEGKVYFGLEDKVNTYTHVVFARFNPDAQVESWDDKEDDGTPKMLWNKTNDLPYIEPANGVAVYKLVDWDAAVLTNETVVATGLDRVELANGIGYAYGVVSAEGAIEVYNVNGAVVARGNDTIDLRGLGRGVYIIRNGNQVRKVVR